MDAVEKRLRRLEACESIRFCIYAYAVAGDRANDSSIIERIFTEDASYEAVGMGHFQGRRAIAEGLGEIARSVVRWSFHNPGGPLIRVAESLAAAEAFWWVWCPARLQAEDGGQTPCWGAGHYNADFVVSNGTWKFKRVTFETRFRTPFEGPWTELTGPFEWPDLDPKR